MDGHRVLCFGYSANLGGVESFIKNIILNTQVPIDLVVTSQDEVPFEEELKAKGSRIFRIPPRRSNPVGFKRNIVKLLKAHPEYKVVHVHLNSCSSIEPLEAARKCGRFCIAHSHSSSSNFSRYSKVMHTVNKNRINKVTDMRLACSIPAGNFLYGSDDYTVVNNGIDTAHFTYNAAQRETVRDEFGIKDRFVVCHIGMFAPVKNQSFLVDTFVEVLKQKSDSVLMMVGEGYQQEEIENKVKELGLSDKVIFTGRRYDTQAIMSAADVFVLPSLFEGLPIVLVEAQSEGLPCIVSDVVTKEAKLSEQMDFLSLDKGAKAWAEKILSAKPCNDRNSAYKAVNEAGFNMADTVKQLEKIYSGALKNKVMIVTSPLRVGGFDIVATNLQTHLDKEKFECTYYIKGDEVGPLEEKVRGSGAKIIHQPVDVRGYIAEYKNLKKVMREGHYNVVHSHLMFYSGLVMRAGCKAGVKKRVPHSHMTNPWIEDRSFLQRCMFVVYSFVMKCWLNMYGTDLIACGPETGDYLYGKRSFKKRGIILNNGIDLSRYKYDAAVREEVRREMGLDGKLVVGHVGRLNYVKNHKFLIDVFYELQKQNPDAVLLIVGDGEEREKIEKKIEKLSLSDKVIITGIRNDVHRLLQGMDVFVFPSLYEGLPLTLIEAQATKLPCLISDSVSRYSKQNENVEFISLSENPEMWAQRAVTLAQADRESVSCEKLVKAYDINEVAKRLGEIYEN